MTEARVNTNYGQEVYEGNFADFSGDAEVKVREGLYSSVEFLFSTLKVKHNGGEPLTLTEVLLNGENILATPLELTGDEDFHAVELVSGAPFVVPQYSIIDVVTDPSSHEDFYMKFEG
jgi:hypothetical protein